MQAHTRHYFRYLGLSQILGYAFHYGKLIDGIVWSYSSTSLVRASVVRGPSVVRGFEWLNFSSH